MPWSNKSSVLVANLFYSSSEVIKEVENVTDLIFYRSYDECVAMKTGNTDKPIPKGVTVDTYCQGWMQGVQDWFDTEANNSTATPLGGTQRLRSYPLYRFHDKYSAFAGLEYRTYFLDNTLPFNWIFEKGVFKAAQLAMFYEVGQVSPTNDSELYRDYKYSAGLGLRLIFSSVVLRADWATGKEGSQTTVFIGYGF